MDGPFFYAGEYTSTMKLTKYGHACFSVEIEGKLLIVDPGVWTTDLQTPENVAAVVVTHEHADHFDPAALGAIIAHNPDAKIIAHQDITRQFGTHNETLPYQSVVAGDVVTIGPFQLEFFGGTHATIHPNLAIMANLGVFINDRLYYPGDSFTIPEKPVDILALPISAPWLKVSETMDFLTAIKPRVAFPTHDAILSSEGKALLDRMLTAVTKEAKSEYRRIDTAGIDI